MKTLTRLFLTVVYFLLFGLCAVIAGSLATGPDIPLAELIAFAALAGFFGHAGTLTLFPQKSKRGIDSQD